MGIRASIFWSVAMILEVVIFIALTQAGEAGAGFAVVASEVRSLALRSAESAKKTADLIESTMKNESFREVADQVEKTGDLIREISAGTREQREGVARINRAVQDLTALVQKGSEAGTRLFYSHRAADLVYGARDRWGRPLR